MGDNKSKLKAYTKNLQSIQDKISDATGLSLYITENSEMLTQVSNPTVLSYDIIEKSTKAKAMVDDFKKGISSKAESFKKPAVAVCSNGVVKISVPVVVNNEVVAFVEGGDVLSVSQSEAEMNETAKKYDINEDEYKSAAIQVKVIGMNEINSICDMIAEVFSIYLEKCLSSNQKLIGENYDGSQNSLIVSNINRISQIYSVTGKEIASVREVIQELSTLTKDAADNLEKTKDIVKTIQNIALNTRILGFNASIEAARAKESGKGFGVIAQEVRSLADVSKSSAEQIEDKINALEESTKQIFEAINSAANHFRLSSESSGEMQQLFGDIVKMIQ